MPDSGRQAAHQRPGEDPVEESSVDHIAILSCLQNNGEEDSRLNTLVRRSLGAAHHHTTVLHACVL